MKHGFLTIKDCKSQEEMREIILREMRDCIDTTEQLRGELGKEADFLIDAYVEDAIDRWMWGSLNLQRAG